MKDFIGRFQRELPDTDRDRYDIAYERGRAQARSKLLFGGLAVGAAIGAAIMWALDPSKGEGRRAQLASRLTGARNGLGRTAGGRIKDIQNRLQGFAIERGIKQPPDRENGTGAGTDYGQGYREGFGQTVHDPTAPGSAVPDPIAPEEAAEFGPSGPVAGAATRADESGDVGEGKTAG